jgi:hypothetical protein
MSSLRSDELQIEAIDRLESALSVPADNVIPVAIAQQSDDLDPRVSVGASLDSTSPNNKMDDTSGTVRVIVDGTNDYIASEGTLGLSRIQSDVVDALTEHSAAFYAAGLSQEEEIAWNDNINRYLGVSQFAFERNVAARSPYNN